MKALAFGVLASFIALSVFGFAGMLASPDMAHASNSCLASLAQNGACPPEENTVASAIFHTNAFKVFSTTVISTILAAVLALFFFGFATSIARSLRADTSVMHRRIDEAIARFLALFEQRLALARFEHSPTFL